MDTQNYRPSSRPNVSRDRRTANRTTYRTTVDASDDRTTRDRTTRDRTERDRSSRTSRPSARTTQTRRSAQSETARRTSERGSASRDRGSASQAPSATRMGKDALAGSSGSVGQRALDFLSEYAWAKWVLLAIAALIIIFILFNLVTCIGGAAAPKSDASQQSASASTEASNQAATTTATQGVASPWTDDGRFSTGDSALDNYVKQLCDEHTSEGATFDQAAYDTYIYVSRTDYIERENNQSPWGENWAQEYAKQYFEAGKTGNCYSFAAVTEYVLKYFGYSDAEAQPCIVKLESGAWGDHGLVFVTNKVDGKRCIVDDALSANGWMLGIDDYDYDVRNIAQNATVKGNVDALDDDNNPTPIPPGPLTETSSGTSANATTGTTNTTDTANNDQSEAEEEYYDEGNNTEEEYYAEEEYYPEDTQQTEDNEQTEDAA